MRKSRTREFLTSTLQRAKADRPRGKLREIARIAKVDPGTLTNIRKNPNYKPGHETFLRIWYAIFEVYPGLKQGNFSLLFEEMSQNMQTGQGGRLSMDEIDSIMALLDILSHKSDLKTDLLSACLKMIKFTQSQLPNPTELEKPALPFLPPKITRH